MDSHASQHAGELGVTQNSIQVNARALTRPSELACLNRP